MNYRNPALLRLAKDMPCMMCGMDDGTVVWAHANSQRYGKGTGIKCHDCFGAPMCMQCHAIYDSSGLPRAVKEENFRLCMERAWLYMWEHGLIKVA